MSEELIQTGPRLTQAERTGLSDRRMLEAAVHLIVDNGPAATSLKEVGMKAGYSRGLAGHRFGSKDKLFAFVLHRVGDRWLTQLKKATDGKTGLEAVTAALQEHYRLCVDAPDHVRAFYTLWFESVNADSELAAIIQHIHLRRRQDVERWVMDDPMSSDVTKSEAEEIAAHFCAAVIGIVYHWLANPGDIEGVERLHLHLTRTMGKLIQHS